MANWVLRITSGCLLAYGIAAYAEAVQDQSDLVAQLGAAFAHQEQAERNVPVFIQEENPMMAENTAATMQHYPAAAPAQAVTAPPAETQTLQTPAARKTQAAPAPAPQVFAAPAPQAVQTQVPQVVATPSFSLPAPTAQQGYASPPIPAARSTSTNNNQFQQWLNSNGFTRRNRSAAGTNSGLESRRVQVRRTDPQCATPTPRSGGRRTAFRGGFGEPEVISKPMTLEQSQRVMLNSAPNSLVAPPQDSKDAFATMLQQNMPMTPRQVVRLHQQIDVAQRAAAIPAVIPPKPVSTTLMINLAPGTTPPAVRLAQGYVTSLVFVDSTGAPWPIASFDIGNPKSVNMQWDGKSNILLMQAITPYSSGDIVIRLVDLPTPVTLELVSGQRVVDYRVDLHIAHIGPNTKELPIGTPLPANANQLLLGVLDGVAPDGSKQLIVPGQECEVWMLGEKMYVRTRLTILSPGWVGKMTSPDGMQAYEIPKTSSILVSRFGEPVELRIEGF